MPSWPGNAQLAVSLSYDDGYDSQLDLAIPDLEGSSFRGTFYLTINDELPVLNRTAEWQQAFLNGHEIGSHTYNHPCRNAVGGEPPLENYTPQAIREEVFKAAAWLNANIGADSVRTFAYPCGDTLIGPADRTDEASYLRAVRSSHFAARVNAGYWNNPADVIQNPLKINAYGVRDDVCPALFRELDVIAAPNHYWVVLMIHAIDQPEASSNITHETHQTIIRELTTREVWVAPVKEVARYILDQWR
jgi:peptidoglycan/xylan/chitin deacetylase (PgdA/CDA1 family)